MPNKYGHLTKDEAKATGITVFVPSTEWIDRQYYLTGTWHGPRPAAGLLLTPNRCKVLGCPLEAAEKPAVLVYNARISNEYRYVPLYLRTVDIVPETSLNTSELALYNKLTEE